MANQFKIQVLTLILYLIQYTSCEPKYTLGCKICASCGGDYPHYGGRRLNTGDWGDWDIFGQQCQGNSYKDLHTEWSLCCKKDYDLNDGICKFCRSCGGNYQNFKGRRINRNDWGGFNIFGNECSGEIGNSFDEFNLCCTRPNLVSLCNGDCGDKIFGGFRYNQHDWGYWSINRAASCGSKYDYYDTLDLFYICSIKCPIDYSYYEGQCYPICPQYCKTCQSPNSCDSCIDGFAKNTFGQCVQCSQNCIKCNIDSCTVCNVGYFLQQGSCIRCLDNCKSCQDNSICDTCNVGYILDAKGFCQKCPKNCNSCNLSQECTQCQEGYNLFQGKCTLICIQNCQNCTSESVCDECDLGFTLDQSRKCIKCQYKCDICLSNGYCIRCSQNYMLQGGICVPICSPNCQICSNPLTCDICNSSFVKDQDGKCIKCGANCEECDSTTNCIRCVQGSKLIQGQCQCNIDSCQICDSSLNCLQCQQGYALRDNKCSLVCSNNCYSCSSPFTCDICQVGFELIPDKNVCKPIYYCTPQCEVCLDSTKCHQCKQGYDLNQTQRDCCPNNCNCIQSNICDSCKPGYKKVENYCKIICPDNCNSCEETNKCKTCLDGYALENGGCIKCNDGKIVQNNKCLECKIPQCAICLSNQNCKNCTDGFYPEPGFYNYEQKLTLVNLTIEQTQSAEFVKGTVCFPKKTFSVLLNFYLTIILLFYQSFL